MQRGPGACHRSIYRLALKYHRRREFGREVGMHLAHAWLVLAFFAVEHDSIASELLGSGLFSLKFSRSPLFLFTSGVYPAVDSALRRTVEFHRFLTELSVLPGSSLDIRVHWLPC